tara:strand:- start:266 stop:577 length:312 start_codon:yes stop_codon:yes gene_type:complete
MRIEAFAYAQWDSYFKHWTYTIYGSDTMESYGYTLIGPVEVEVPDIPHDILIAKTVKAYRAEQAKIRADAEEKAMKLDETIQTMLALEYIQPTAAEAGTEVGQ